MTNKDRALMTNHVRKSCPLVVSYSGTLLALLLSTTSTVSKLRNGRGAVTMRMTTRSTCMQGASLRAIPTTHHPRADDITKRTVTKTLQEVITKVGKASRMLKKGCGRHRGCNEPKQRRTSGRFHRSGSVTSMRTLCKVGRSWARGYVGNCVQRNGSWVQLLTYSCSSVAERQARLRSGTSWMDGDGTFLECRVFIAGPPHHFSQHGVVDTLNGVGASTAQLCRLQSF